MNKEKLREYKDLLLKEEEMLRKDLGSRGRKILDSDNPDWVATPNKDDGFSADPNENADDIEDFEANIAIVSELEEQYNEVTGALRRIEKDEYGICNKCGEEIEGDRLRAVPTATTCKKHI